jgi:hypothetical protein
VTSSRATNRTATFVFYIDDRYYGVVTAYVQGREAEHYKFTSALPVTILKLLAPAIVEHLATKATAAPLTAGENYNKVKLRDINFTPSRPRSEPIAAH